MEMGGITTKRRFIFCIALILNVGLLGCATAERHGRDRPPEAAAVDKVKLRVVKVDSEETSNEDGHGKNAVDGNPNTYWHTQWHGNSPGLPHEIIIELLPPATIKGFSYLPRQDPSDHGTIKDYEFYVSDDGWNFGRPVKKGTFDPGKGEQIETFEPVKCRFIKLRALSEINGLPWTSAAEIRVVQNGEDATAKDYWRGDLGPSDGVAGKRHFNGHDRIGAFVAALAADGGLWVNGIDANLVTKARTPSEVVAETLRAAKFEAGLLTHYRILEIREVHIDPFPASYTAALVETNLGQMIVLMQYLPGKESAMGYWWRRVYAAVPQVNRLY